MNNKIYKLKGKLDEIAGEIESKKNLKKHILWLENMLKQPYLSVEIKALLAKAYLQAGKAKEALDTFKHLYECTNSEAVLTDLVYLLMDIGDVKQARVYIDSIPYSAHKNYLEGYYNRRMGNYEDAIKNYELLKHTMLEEDMFVELGNTYALMGDSESAKKCFYNLMKTTKKYQAIVRLIKIALGENDPNIVNLFKQFDIDNCYHKGDAIQYKRCLMHYKYLKGEQIEPDNYLSKQLCEYDKKSAVKHIKYKHQVRGKLYRFLSDIDIESIYDYCANHLEVLIFKEDKDHYLVKMPYDIGYLMDYKTDLLEVMTISGTNKILTIYPITKEGKYNFNKIKERNQNNEK